ncbi:hypothetical protein HYPBUDRAFT_104733 [Hyphopichia burtonii NRRL Y-1933]|uniref:Uncharacterized protein n=1 Tax=Hyphopichia burtonii NRRL Y-1933 TaxID=984485 RepID=A0A1E4RPG3_9ASCO|nr:hypothetical protein HYPBUDRAFT_104733 [Hyphopichia burtonii NRRL Y-1933]ODV69159.1 hypothetical protein HYPBUDRAFT_104733 [Hyphopichia burtonii NRRL Y-1933]
MIQRYTCVPTSEYDVAIVTNGTIEQIESKLIEINEKTNNEIPLHSNFTYLDNFKELLDFLKQHTTKNNIDEIKFKGKVVFMFFNGVEFIQDILSDLIDYSIQVANNSNHQNLSNAYFYFDSTISFTSNTTPTDLLNDANLFNTMVTIANDILKKINFMVDRIRGIFIDDIQLAGEKVYPLHCIMRNFPNVERIELTSFSSLLMNDMIV